MPWLKHVCYVFFILQTLAWTSCQKNEKASILVIALDKLPSDTIMCTDESNNETSGVAILCKESIRFTHSYTTSTQSAAAMGSLLTGQYPISHNLYRSFDRLNPLSISVAQIAKKNNYVTSFFSGSPFILRRTGLSDYFDVFDDSIASSPTEFDTDFKQQAQSFFQWVSSTRHPFFSVIYNSELNKLSNTETDQSSFEKLDEKLYQFFTEMKAQGLWDKTYIFLIGLNGSNKYSRFGMNAITNLHSENTSVATLIKIPRQKGDEGINWKNDLRINLADLGYTLQCLLGGHCQSSTELFPVLDLSELWSPHFSSDTKALFERPILVQTTDNFIRFFPQHRFSVLDINYNFIQNEKNHFEIFNTLSDKAELIDLSNSTNEIRLPQRYIDYLNNFNTVKNGEDVDETYIEQQRSYEELTKQNYDFWTRTNARETIFQNSISEYNPLFINYLYYIHKINKQKPSNEIEAKIVKIKSTVLAYNPCIDLIHKINLSKEDLKSCSDDLFLQYLLYIHAPELNVSEEKNRLLYSVMKSFYKNSVNRISVNLAHHNAWGLYKPGISLLHPLVFLDPNFFDN